MTRLHSLSALALLLTACGPGIGNGPSGTSRLGESCASRNDCITGLTCKDQKCVVDETTTRSCAEIETAYQSSVSASANTACTKSSDCTVLPGLCKSTVATGGPVSKSAEASFTRLDDEWDANGCDENTTCSVGFGSATPWCEQSTCVAKPKCSKALFDICLTGDCGLYSSNPEACAAALADRTRCDEAAVNDPTIYKQCLSGNRDQICPAATPDAHAANLVKACGTTLGLLLR